MADYRIATGGTLRMSELQNVFTAADDVTVKAGIFILDIDGAALSLTVDVTTTFIVDTGATFECCDVTHPGTFTVLGTWKCNGAIVIVIDALSVIDRDQFIDGEQFIDRTQMLDPKLLVT